MRIFLTVAVLLIVFVISGLSLISGPDDLRHSETPAQMFVGIVMILHGVAGMGVILAFWRRSRWLMPVAFIWAIAVSLAAGVAPVAFGGQHWTVGVMSGGVTALFFGAIVFFFHRTGRKPPSVELKQAP